MKLSEAINLGAHTIEHLKAGRLSGCALGMAANAVGIKRSYYCIDRKWPWLEERRLISPCECRRMDGQEAKFIIAHLFDSHIVHDMPSEESNTPWTLEQLADYVRSIEPAEESTLPDLPLSEQLRLEEEAAAEEGAAIEASGYMDPANHPRFA